MKKKIIIILILLNTLFTFNFSFTSQETYDFPKWFKNNCENFEQLSTIDEYTVVGLFISTKHISPKIFDRISAQILLFFEIYFCENDRNALETLGYNSIAFKCSQCVPWDFEKACGIGTILFAVYVLAFYTEKRT